MRTVAVIPVKTISERVESKNFRNFFEGNSLFDLLIEKLLDSKSFDEIYVSSNSNHLKESLEKRGINYISRPEEFCNNNTPWSDVISYVIESIPEPNDTNIAWCHTTSPTFSRYKEAIDKYLNQKKDNSNDGLITVIKSSDFIISERLQPLNYSWGPWHKYSQFLEKFFYITGALFITSKENMLKNRYVISKNPYLFEVNDFEAIDIDSEYDFELAKILMENKKKLIKND
jgi:N-acylneuraminate cytidylyltransferase